MSDNPEKPEKASGNEGNGNNGGNGGNGGNGSNGSNGKPQAPSGQKATAKATGGASEAGMSADGLQSLLDEETQRKLAALRTRLREAFGAVVMAMMLLPRYRHMAISDLQHLVLEPMLNDRIAIAHPRDKEGKPVKDLVGIAIWASVSEEVDRKIREQIRAGVFPVRLKPNEWRSGEINWLLDVIAPDRKATAAVIASFRQLIKGSELRLHPIVSRMLDEETLKKLGVRRRGPQKRSSQSSTEQGSPQNSAAGLTEDGETKTSDQNDDLGDLDQFDFSTSEKKKPH